MRLSQLHNLPFVNICFTNRVWKLDNENQTKLNTSNFLTLKFPVFFSNNSPKSEEEKLTTWCKYFFKYFNAQLNIYPKVLQIIITWWWHATERSYQKDHQSQPSTEIFKWIISRSKKIFSFWKVIIKSQVTNILTYRFSQDSW